MSKTKLFLLFLLFVWSYQSFGQENIEQSHTIDINLNHCLSVDSNLTTLGMTACFQTAHDDWDKELNKNYGLLLRLLDSLSQIKLREAQRQWLDYRDQEYEYLNYVYYNKNGSMWRVVASERKTEIIKARALELKSYFYMLSEQ